METMRRYSGIDLDSISDSSISERSIWWSCGLQQGETSQSHIHERAALALSKEEEEEMCEKECGEEEE